MKLPISLPATVMAAIAITGQTSAEPATVPAAAFPAGEGQAVVQSRCAACHPPAVVAGKHLTASQWADVVDQMIGKGATVSDAEYDVIVGYLARTYGPAKPAVAG